MAPITLEPEAVSTPPASCGYDRWSSTAGEPDASGYALLSKFDLVVSHSLNRVAALKKDWDAQGAYRINPRIIDTARRIASALPCQIKTLPDAIPTVVPMRKGNLQFEWHEGPRTLELEIENPSTVHYLKFHPEAGIEEEDTCPVSDTDTLAGLILWFVEG